MTDDRRLGTTAAAATVVASMIGAGIYTSPGYTLGSLGTGGWTLAAWGVGGLIAVCGAVSYGALASRITRSGGEYTYLSQTVHPFVGFLAGWVSLVAGFAGAAATAAASLATHLPVDGPAATGIAAAVLVAAGVLHGWRVREAAGVQTLVVVGKLLLILFGLSAAAIYAVGRELPEPAETSTTTQGTFAVSLMWIAMSYSGFNAAIYFSEEVRDAARTVPRALVVGTAATVAVYLCIVAAVVSLPPREAVANRDDPVAATAEVVFAGGGRAVAWLICLSQATSVSALALAGPRVTARMAADGLLPRFLAGRTESCSAGAAVSGLAEDSRGTPGVSGTPTEPATPGAASDAASVRRADSAAPGVVPPRAAIALHTTLAVGLLLVASLRDLLFHVGATLSLSAAAAVASLLVLARRGDAPPGVAWKVAAPVFVVATLGSVGIAIVEDWHNGLGVAAALVSGAAAYAVARTVCGGRHSEDCEGAAGRPAP